MTTAALWSAYLDAEADVASASLVEGYTGAGYSRLWGCAPPRVLALVAAVQDARAGAPGPGLSVRAWEIRLASDPEAQALDAACSVWHLARGEASFARAQRTAAHAALAAALTPASPAELPATEDR